jgi:hypothetical protein
VPTTVRDVFASAGLEPAGVVRWEAPIPSPVGAETGVSVVALVEDPDSLDGIVADCPLGRLALDELVEACPALTLDGEAATAEVLAQRLSALWLPDEVVL